VSKYSNKVARRKTDRAFTEDKYSNIQLITRKRCSVCGLKIRGNNHFTSKHHLNAVAKAGN